MALDVILPAGGHIDGEFADRVGTKSKALIHLEGETVLSRTIRALRASEGIARIAVIGGPEVHEEAKRAGADVLVPEGATGPENIFRGLDELAKDNLTSKVLIVTCDLPFLTKDLISQFVRACPNSIDICVPLISQTSFGERFPGTHATFIALKDGVWTTGCAYVIDAQALRNAKKHIERVFENRKSKFGMARLLGPVFVVKWLMKSLTLDDVEAKIRSLLGCSGAAVRNCAPELSFDLDYLDDYEYALTWIKNQSATLL
ncbi:MAG: nucleotidyltransferase family protein [Armatimonadetes bacterium]|nr:nucleotidyltransferase family protein [Armatimonadota bacterium]